jgi:hypothetical protein
MSKIETYYERENEDSNNSVINQYPRMKVIMNKIMEYFKNRNVIEDFLSIINAESHLSLRIIDFFVTNYARENEVIYEIINDKEKKEKFMVHYSYKAQLKAYSKKQFDPFCRRERILFTIDGYNDKKIVVRTTVGQLNFFRWAIKNGVLNYISENIGVIEKEMNKSHKKIKNKKIVKHKITKRKKIIRNKDKIKNEKVEESFTINTKDKDLKLSTSKSVSKHNVVITVKFD